jgi:hypothetical protein
MSFCKHRHEPLPKATLAPVKRYSQDEAPALLTINSFHIVDLCLEYLTLHNRMADLSV